jgi:hypothetical protein
VKFGEGFFYFEGVCLFVWFFASISILRNLERRLREQSEGGKERKTERRKEGNELFSRAGGYAAG